MKITMGIRVTEEEELVGLDMSEHGTYGYPEQMKLLAESEGKVPEFRSGGKGYLEAIRRYKYKTLNGY